MDRGIHIVFHRGSLVRQSFHPLACRCIVQDPFSRDAERSVRCASRLNRQDTQATWETP